MIKIQDVATSGLRMTNKMIAEQALTRGWEVWSYCPGTPHLRLKRADGKFIEIHSSTPETTSQVAASRVEDKYCTHVLLEDDGFPVPETYLIGKDEKAETVLEVAQKVLGSGKKCVVKPLDSAHGNGVTVGLSDPEGVLAALKIAGQFSDKAVLQECVEQPIDVRVLCVGYKCAAALVRIPARVQGDGISTVQQLIEKENQNERRGADYTAEMNFIDIAATERYLKDGLQRVPAAGEWVQVLGTANVGTGGETMDVTDDLPDWLIHMAEEVAKIMELPVCGVDFLVRQEPKVNLSQEELNPKIIEVNSCPSLFIHEMPVHGQPRPVIKIYLDYLEKIAK